MEAPTYVIISKDALDRLHGSSSHLMSCVIEDENSRTTHEIDLREDGNKTLDNEGNTWLHFGAKSGNEPMIKGFIHHMGSQRLDLNIKNKDNETPLYLAVKEGRQKMVEILLDAGADVNLCCANKSTPLIKAVFSNNISIVKLLIGRGAKFTEAGVWAPNSNNEQVIVDGCTPLLAAACSGSEELVRYLISLGDSPHQLLKNGCNALHLACNNPDRSVMSLLLNVFQVDPNQKESRGFTPLVVISDHEMMVNFLKDKRVKIDSVDNERLTPLYRKCRSGKASLITLLLNHGANPNFLIDLTTTFRTEPTPFAVFAKRLTYIDILSTESGSSWYVDKNEVVEITRLFFQKGAKMNAAIKENFDIYVQKLKNDELSNLIKMHYKEGCLVS